MVRRSVLMSSGVLGWELLGVRVRLGLGMGVCGLALDVSCFGNLKPTYRISHLFSSHYFKVNYLQYY